MADSLWQRARGIVLRSKSATELLQTLRFELTHRSAEPPIVVHQMARVGSITVLHALLSKLPSARVFHTHYLNPATVALNRKRLDELHRARGETGLHREFLAAIHLNRRMQRRVDGKWRIITMVRDPVARTVSAFFRHFPFQHPELDPRFHENPSNVPRLIELFLDEREYERRVALEWFDREVAEVFGIDVFATPFSPEAGSAIYESPRYAMLLLRTEDMDRIGGSAISRFLDVGVMPLVTTNRAREQTYAAAYERFLACIELPGWYLDEMYGSRLARHFYSDEELDGMRRQWAGMGKGEGGREAAPNEPLTGPGFETAACDPKYRINRRQP